MAYKIKNKPAKEKKKAEKYMVVDGEIADIGVRGYYLTSSEYIELLDKYREKPLGTQASIEDIQEIVAKRDSSFKITPEKKENASSFLNANYTKIELNKFSDKEIEDILRKNKKEWNY